MPKAIVKAFPEKSQELADALAAQIVAAQDEALDSHASPTSPTAAHPPAFYVAVSGGSLVATLRKALLGRSDVKWGSWKIYFADERVVPLDDPDSNYGLLKKELLDHLPAGTLPPQVFAVDTALPTLAATAEAYEQVLHATVHATGHVVTDAATHESRLVPKLDLVLLGCGPDGHTCSLFPGHALLAEHARLVADLDDSPKPPPQRVTLTKPVLAAARHIVFVAEGAGKAPVLDRILGKRDVVLPATQVNQLAARAVTWYVSDSAVKNLKL